MTDILIERSANIEALEAELRADLGALVKGVSAGPYGVILHLAADAAPHAIQQARAIAAAHDPAILTPGQQAAQTRQQTITQGRRDHAQPLNPADYIPGTATPQAELIRTLAARIAWLEAELRDLRGL